MFLHLKVRWRLYLRNSFPTFAPDAVVRQMIFSGRVFWLLAIHSWDTRSRLGNVDLLFERSLRCWVSIEDIYITFIGFLQNLNAFLCFSFETLYINICDGWCVGRTSDENSPHLNPFRFFLDLLQQLPHVAWLQSRQPAAIASHSPYTNTKATKKRKHMKERPDPKRKRAEANTSTIFNIFFNMLRLFHTSKLHPQCLFRLNICLMFASWRVSCFQKKSGCFGNVQKTQTCLKKKKRSQKPNVQYFFLWGGGKASVATGEKTSEQPSAGARSFVYQRRCWLLGSSATLMDQPDPKAPSQRKQLLLGDV